MITIGIMGAPVNNPNHGCMALLYSLLSNLEEIGDFQYILFDWKYDAKSMERISKRIGVKREQLLFSPFVMRTDFVRYIYHFFSYQKMKKNIKACDFIIDLSEGDSFSDIYGDFLYKGRTNIKRLVEQLNIPLILGPQTYGPFLKEENQILARKVIEKAQLVFTRDYESKELLDNWKIPSVLCQDLAFSLPYEEYAIPFTDKIKVGINVSSILMNEKEIKDKKFHLKVDYKKYIETLTEELLSKDIYEIYWISHVNDDYSIHQKLFQQYPNTHLIPIFVDPIEAKSCIAQMDIFIGARMHGTIAAYSTGIACIPTSYSPKFKGMYQAFGYSVEVDLCSLDTTSATLKTMEYVQQYKKLSGSKEQGISWKSTLKKWIGGKS